jgi:hypothetical protein
MRIANVDGHTVELLQIDRAGAPWVVRLYKKVLLIRRLVSSDWFLDESQARRFAQQLADEIGRPGGTDGIKERKPGWTLHRPPH